MRSIGVVALALAGCSLIYNPNNLPDPRVIDAAVLDSNPCALELTSIAPLVIQEGQGADGSLPALLVLHGNNILANNLKVAITVKDGAAVHLDPIADPMVSGDTTYLAFTVSAPVDDALGSSPASFALDVTVTQDAPRDGSCMFAASRTLSDALTYRALPELKAAPVTSSLYSQITLPATAFPTGGPRVELNAVSSITVGNLIASASTTMAGPGGYSAGTAGGPGVGQDGGSATVLGRGGGGGGGGFAVTGSKGDDATGNGGPGGPPSGQSQILSYDDNRASAGGTGGRGLTALGAIQAGGTGGGGGGVVVLSAGGDITAGAVTASGAQGGQGQGSAIAGGGGGGGGAGGTIVVRSAAGKLMLGALHVAGGPGGLGGGGGAGSVGGPGSVGRVRWDSPVDGAPTSPDAAPRRGPAFTAVTRVVTTAEPTFTLVGTPGDEIDVRAIDSREVPHAAPHASFNDAGVATIHPTLSPGYNQLCAKLSGGAESQAAANTCITVAYLPPAP